MVRLAQAVRDPAETLAVAVDAVVRKEARRRSLRTTRTSAGGSRVHACFRPRKRASAHDQPTLSEVVPSGRELAAD